MSCLKAKRLFVLCLCTFWGEALHAAEGAHPWAPGAFVLKAIMQSAWWHASATSEFIGMNRGTYHEEPGGSGVGLHAGRAGAALAEQQPARVSVAATAAQAVVASPGADAGQPTAHGALQATQQAPGAAQRGCAQRFAAPAQHHADPFGILEYQKMWPANSTLPVKPRPLPVGPAYNSSQFDVFINTSFVMLVRSPGLQVQGLSLPGTAATSLLCTSVWAWRCVSYACLCGTVAVCHAKRYPCGVHDCPRHIPTSQLTLQVAEQHLERVVVTFCYLHVSLRGSVTRHDCLLWPQNYVHFLSPTANGSWFPPGAANMIRTTFRPVCQVMYAESLLWTVRVFGPTWAPVAPYTVTRKFAEEKGPVHVR